MTEEELAEVVGSSAMRDYADVRDYEKSRLLEWAARLRFMSNDELFTETVQAVSGAALANNRSWYWDPDHFRSTACWHEAQRRHTEAGHDEECRGSTIYSRAHARAMRDHGFDPSPSTACTCGLEG